MSENFNIFPLFSCPIYWTENIEYTFTDEENECIDSFDMVNNKSWNKVTTNYHILENKILNNIKNICQNHLDIFTKKVLNINEEFYITNSWVTKTEKNGLHQNHTHQNSIFSGILYINASPEMGNVGFYGKPGYQHDHNFQYSYSNYNIYNSPYWWIPAKTGSLIIFPSWLLHGTTENNADETRVMIGFNSFVRGEFGIGNNSDYASYLKI